MSEAKSKARLDRRDFLKALGTSTAGVATVAVAASTGITPAAASESSSDKKKKRYQESDHVKAYYRTNRY
ncbi:MAG: twin-arginine translocation signal domain-containing protein [Hyphomicrobium sp.]